MFQKKILTSLSLLMSLCLMACSSQKSVPSITEKSSSRLEQARKTTATTSKQSSSSSTKASSSQARSSSTTTGTSRSTLASSSKASTTSKTSSSSTSATSSTSASKAATTKSSSTPSSGAKNTPTVVSLPAEAVGTWKGSTNQASSVTLTISADGSFHVISEFGDNYKVDETLTVGKLELIAPNVYHIAEYSGSVSPLLPGVTGLGGSGSKSTHGFTIQNGKYSPLIWTVPTAEDYDFSQRNTFGVVLTKE